MNRLLLPFFALAIGLLPSFAGALESADIERIARSAGESLPGVVPPETGIAVPKGSPATKTAPSKETWGVMVDRTVQVLGVEAAPCARRPSRTIVCSLDESIKLSDSRVPGMLGAGLNALLSREAKMRAAAAHPVHRYTTRNGPSEFSCFHPTVRTNCRYEKDTINLPVGGVTMKWVCDEVEAQSHDCACTRGCN